MNKNLLIIGAGIYAVVAYEIAEDMGCFDKIAFVDDNKKTTPNGMAVIGTTKDIPQLGSTYNNIVVAIGNPKVRLSLIEKIEKETSCKVATLISPMAYISPTAEIMQGCIIEPMAVVHTGCVISKGCIISSGAVVNHLSRLLEGVHIDCNATVAGYCQVPAETKVNSSTVFNSLAD